MQMKMIHLYVSDFPFKNFRKITAQHAETIRKNVWEKSYDAYSLSIRVQTTINHISICFLNINVKENVFLFRAREEHEVKKALRETLTQAAYGWDLVMFDWFVLSMRMQIILDSLFARPGSAPIWGGKKWEFRDWLLFIVIKAGPYIAGGQEGQLPPPGKLIFFSNIVFD